MLGSKARNLTIIVLQSVRVNILQNAGGLRQNPIEHRAISGFSGQKSVPEEF